MADLNFIKSPKFYIPALINFYFFPLQTTYFGISINPLFLQLISSISIGYLIWRFLK